MLTTIKTTGPKLPNRVILHGVEGVGKTSFGAQAPSPVFIQARGETGLETLIDSGRVGETAHFPEVQGWQEALNCLAAIVEQEHQYKTLVIDTLNGLERLCHEYVCQRDFNGDWTDKGFLGYMRGFEVSLSEWRILLDLLDKVRTRRRMSVLCLVHTAIKPFKNPEGPDYDRYVPDMHHKTWGLTHKWADLVLFANFVTVVQEKRGERVKGKGGQQRVLLTERHAAYDAKNRAGLPEEIDLGTNAAEGWQNFITALRGGA